MGFFSIPKSLKSKAAQSIASASKDAVSWLRAKSVSAIKKKTKTVSGNKAEIGGMYLFAYSAKTEKVLPYWDALPLIILVNKKGKHFHGLNTHYLPVGLRMKLIGQLKKIADSNNTKQKKLKLTYNILASVTKSNVFKPTYKQYLFSHVKSGFSLIPEDEWKYVALLPLAKWQKESSSTVYRDSKGSI
ncbi:MAG: hypothetical protein R8M45_03845 [Ghiorsea sp.]